MDILSEMNTRVSFEAKLKGLSVSYQRTMKVATKHFEAFCIKECNGRTIIETFDYLKTLPSEEKEAKIYHLFQTWINKLSDARDPTTVKNYFMSVKKLARHHSIKISNDDVKENLTFPKKLRERKYVMTLDDIHQILTQSTWKKKGFYLFLLSTGMRPQEALSIRKRHIKLLDSGRYMITIPAESTKLKVEREAFVSREVYPYLAKILRSKKENDLIWTGSENTVHAVTSAGSAFRNCCERVGLTQKYETVDRFKLNLYCFRAFFYSKASIKHGDEYAHKMIGHEGYMPMYDRKTLDEMIRMYADFEDDLIADQTLKQKDEIEKLKGEKQRHVEEMRENFLKWFMEMKPKQIERLMKNRVEG